jgi:hypothetical protein
MSPTFSDAFKQQDKKDVKQQEPLKVEVKPDPIVSKAEESKPVQPESKQQGIVIHSELDAFVMDRLKSQPKTLDEIDLQVVSKPEEGAHRLRLPVELECYKDRYAFCWIFKRKQAIDEACDLLHYQLTNRTYFPDLPDHLFSARGVIERGDNILAFRSRKIDEEMRRAPGIESNERIKARFNAHAGDATYYVPDAEYERQLDGTLKKIPVVGV